MKSVPNSRIYRIPETVNSNESVGHGPTFLLVVGPIEKITEIITPSLEAMGYEVVRVLMSGNRSPTLQVMVERRDAGAMTVEDCADVSRTISALLDVEDPIPSAYQLEVSSPGIDRPLVKEADFARFAGFEARIETVAPIEGRRRFQGRLLGLEDHQVTIRLADGEAKVPYQAIKKAKLVLTDELLAAAQRRS